MERRQNGLRMASVTEMEQVAGQIRSWTKSLGSRASSVSRLVIDSLALRTKRAWNVWPIPSFIVAQPC